MVSSLTGVALSWIPLGAGLGGAVVRQSGRLYEACVAVRERRRPEPLFHTALEVLADGHRFVIEMAPVWSLRVPDRGVVSTGPVGSRWLGRLNAFRYEVRCWRDGTVPDAMYAVGGAVAVATNARRTQLLLDEVSAFPAMTWGRDELGTGEMWNSNSLTAWLLARSGHDLSVLKPPRDGRAPGWTAGAVAARRLLLAPGAGVTDKGGERSGQGVAEV